VGSSINVFTIISLGKISIQVFFECLLVRLSKTLLELNEEVLSLFDILLLFVLNKLLSLQFLLDFTLKAPLLEDSMPVDLILIDESPLTMHEVALPLAIVAGPIHVLHLAESVHLALQPLTSVNIATGELVYAVPVHLVIFPVALVFLGANLA
jgi:hypothetical protein